MLIMIWFWWDTFKSFQQGEVKVSLDGMSEKWENEHSGLENPFKKLNGGKYNLAVYGTVTLERKIGPQKLLYF